MPSLGKDLANLRKKQDLEIKDVHETTKLPPAILESIEDDSIFENTDSSNATYIRSYVRSYAKAIGVKEQNIIQALNEVETGSYSGGLPVKDTGKSSSKDIAKRNSEKERQKKKKKEKENTESESLEWIAEPLEEKNKDEEIKEAESAEKTEAGARSDEAIFSMPKRPSSDDWDWVQVGYQANTESSGGSAKIQLLGIIILIILIILGIWWYSSSSDGDSATGATPEIDNTEEPTSSSDSLRQALIEDSRQNGSTMNEVSSSSSGPLPDTLTIGIIAAGDELKPVRVYTDILGKRNPYWVARGDTIHLNFVDSVRIYAANQYDRLRLVFNNQPIQNFYEQYYNSDRDLLELSRKDIEANPEWRRPS